MMSSTRIHHLVATCISCAAFLLFLSLWISAADDRNTDHLVWAIFTMVATLIAGGAFAAGAGKRTPPRTDWLAWALPLPLVAAGIISTLA